MRILRLSLRNLASLAGTHTVDFERDPLRSTGLFSISGPTGSGKSTLLDALTLALYEQTPRLAAASGTKLPDVAESEITQKDPGNLLRRGEAEGFAEVAFVGVDGLTYTSRWSIRRARQRRDGALQGTELVLFRGNVRPGETGPIECGGKKSEVLPAIAAKVGLTFAQFTRAVLLAQNDFAVFLRADDKERAAILQALTGTERFEVISRAVFERERLEREAVEQLRQRAAGQLPLDPERRAAAEAELREAQEQVAAARQRTAAHEAHLGWFARQRGLAAELERAGQSLATARQAVDDAAVRRREFEIAEAIARGARTLFDAEVAADAQCVDAAKTHQNVTVQAARAADELGVAQKVAAEAKAAADAAHQAGVTAAPRLQQARALDTQLGPLAKLVAERRRERDALAATLAQQSERRDRIAMDLSETARRQVALEQKRAAIAYLDPVLAESAGWLERLKAVVAARREHERCVRDAAAKAAAEPVERAKVDAAREALEKQMSLRATVETARAAAETELGNHDAEALAAERRALDARHAELTVLQADAAKALDLAQRLATARTEAARNASDAEREGKALAELRDRRLPQAMAAAQAAKSMLQSAEAAASDAAAKWREALRDGAPCPVCGATEHPFSQHAPVVDAVLLSLRERDAEAQAEVQRGRELAAKCEAAVTLFTEQARRKTADTVALEAALGPVQRLVAGRFAAAGLGDPGGTECGAAVDAALYAVAEARTSLAMREARQRAAAKAYEVAVKDANAAGAAVAAAEKAHALAVAALDRTLTARQVAEEAATRAGQAQRVAEESVAPLFAQLPADHAAAFAADSDRFITEFVTQTNALRSATQELATLASRVAQVTVEGAEVVRAISGTEEALRQKAEEERRVSAEHAGLERERRELFAGRSADDVERELTAAATQQRAAFEAAAARLATAEQTAAAAHAAVTAAAQASAAASSRRAASAQALDRWMAELARTFDRAFDRTQVGGVLRRPETWFVRERDELAALVKAVSVAEGAIKVRQEALAEHAKLRATPDDEPAVTAALAACQQAEAQVEQRRAAATAVLAADDLRRSEHAGLLQEIAARQLRAEPWAMLNDLIGSADGAKFRTIVQGRTLDWLLQVANLQLELLSARYRLERLRPSLNLIVVDRDMADERRSVHSLSGGESFLVSLALALGLASLTSNRMRIESLFIDEGFGSLDQATLNTAMNALMHLEAQGRKVGVISHVTEMADAIPVQIRVVKGQSGASRIVVPGAAAAEECAPAMGEPAAPPVAIAPVAAQLLEILRRHHGSGTSFVSVASLRRELGCDADVFAAARAAVSDQLVAQGRSLGLRPTGL